MNTKVEKEKKTECCDTCPIKDAEEYDANCRKHLKDVMKSAEKAVKELADKTASEKARLQGTKETKAPNLKPYTEEFNAKNRAELGQLIEKARRNNVPWKISRCSEELAKQGYRYTFYTVKDTNAVVEGFTPRVKEPKLVLSEDIEVEVLPPEEDSMEAAPEAEEVNPLDILMKYFGLSGDEETSTVSLCLKKNPEDEGECACVSFTVEPEEFAVLAPMFTADSEPEKLDNIEEPVEECKLKESKEEEPKLESFEEQMDFLSADEQEAIDGYEKVLGLVEDEHVKDQLNKILEEERAHKEFLEAVKADPSLEYSHEHTEEEPAEEIVDIELPAESDEEGGVIEEDFDEEEEYEDPDMEVKKLANSGKVTINQVINWIYEHEMLADDFEWFFGYSPEEDFKGEMKKPELEEVLAWLADHDGAWEDFKSFFKLKSNAIEEASSAEKKAYRNGGEDYQDYIDGKAIARVKDPDERAMLLHQKRMEKKGKKMSDRPEVSNTLDRKVQQATKAFDKKQASMAKAGVSEEQQLNEEPIDEAVNIRLDDLKLFNPWGGAKDTWKLIIDQDKLDALEKALEDMYPEGIAGTELNDLLWFEQEWVFDKLDIDPTDLVKAKGDDIIDGEAEIVDVED